MATSDTTPTERDRDRPPTVVVRTSRSQWVASIGLGLAVAYVIVQGVIAQYQANVSTSTAAQLAEPLAELCRDGDVRSQVGDARCRVASDVQREPSAAAGRDGRDGRGIASTALDDGHLVVTFTDGERRDLGRVLGATGPTGPTGTAGRGIRDASLDAEGHLVVSYTDGKTQTVGRVVGRDGVDGRGVDRVEARDGRLLVYYTTAPDDAVDVGPLPPGPPGRGVATLDLDLDSCTVTIRYTDGTSETKNVTGCDGGAGGTTTTEPPPPTDVTTTDTSPADGGVTVPLPGN